MTLAREAAPSAQEPDATRQRRAVLIVHGVGEQKKSDTLLRIGSHTVEWVMRFARQFYGRDAVQIERVALSFTPFDGGESDRPSYAIIDLPDQRWYVAEAWWAGSNFHPDLATMLTWSFAHLFGILAQMVRATLERARYLLHPNDPNTSSQPPFFWQLVDLVNCIALGIGYALACIAGYVLLVPLMVLAQIPIDSIQNFFLFTVLRPMLTAGAGEFRMYLDDELQAANVRRRVGDTARQLLELATCDELIIVAHSEGCVVSLGMLTDPACADIARCTRKLLTYGAGLNKSWLLRPRLDRLFAPLEGDVLWTDFWASYDPVPAGQLDPSRRRLPSGARFAMTDMYHPTGDALVQVGPNNPPISEQVTNSMNVLSDHGGYFGNDEQVVLRLAAEISASHHADSAFWPAASVLFDGVRRRRVRVSALALWRDIAVAFWALGAVVPWVFGWIRNVDPWSPVSTVPVTIGPAGALINFLQLLATQLPSQLAPISGLANGLLQLPALIGLAVLFGALVWAVYTVVQWLWWNRWNDAAQAEFLERCVASSRERLKASRVI